eukprot:Skav230574  [mRNA]  locus=scaffold971:156334:157617:- [translate_table: standard]
MAAAAALDLTTEDGRTQAIALLDPDFQGLLERKEVTGMMQATLATLGLRSISKFAVLGDAAADIRTFVEANCGLQRGRDAVQIASIVDAWNASKTRMVVRHQAEAEASAAKLPPPVNRTELQDLKVRFEQMHYRLEDKVTPASGTIEQLCEQVDAGEWKNMSLIQFMSRDDQDTEPLAATIDKGGSVKIKKGFGESKPPKDAEELRQKLKLVCHCYLFMQLKYPNREVLRGLHPHHWNLYAGYLLGEHVMGLKSTSPSGEVVSSPGLALVLTYEYQVRKYMMKKVNDGMTMVDAMEEAMKDTTTKERYFLTPAALGAVSRAERPKSRSPRRDEDDYRRDRGRDKGRKGSGKSKGKGKGFPWILHSKTPDNRAICYSWNNKDQRCRFKCGRLHVCQYCFKQHPAHTCKTGNLPEHEGDKDTSGGRSSG